MRKISLITAIVIVAISCKLQPDSNRDYDKYDENRVYKLQLNPAAGSVYQYEINNETEINIEAESKEINTINRSEVGLDYSVAKDSVGNFVFTSTFDKIKLHSKSGDAETEADASRAAESIDPVEKMLGILKSASIVSTVSSTGEIKHVSGYKELEDKLLANFPEEDHYSRSMAQSQWEKVVGDGLLKNTMNQIFRIFPDSAIHIRDTWKMDSKQGGELPFNIKSIYTLKAINNDIAIVSSEGVIISDGEIKSVMGYNGVAADLKGKQKGEFEVETKTGMLINSKITATIEGSLQVMGKEIPITINNSIKMNGRKKSQTIN